MIGANDILIDSILAPFARFIKMMVATRELCSTIRIVLHFVGAKSREEDVSRKEASSIKSVEPTFMEETVIYLMRYNLRLPLEPSC